jgi:hypothetical protein
LVEEVLAGFAGLFAVSAAKADPAARASDTAANSAVLASVISPPVTIRD